MEEIDIKELLFEFWKNKILIIILLIIGIVVGMLYSAFLVKPMYKSSTTLILTTLNSDNSTTTAITTNDITMNQKLVSTYSELIKSKSVVKRVIEELSLNISEDSLISSISVQAKKNTEMLEITVSYNDPNVAASIANTLANAFSGKVKEVYNIDNVSVIDIAEPDGVPYNVNMLKTTGIFAIGALFIACVIIFIRMFFNNTIRSQEEAEKFFGLPILAVIPEVKDCRGDKKV